MYGREQSNNPSRFLKEAGLIEEGRRSEDPFSSDQRSRTSSTDGAYTESGTSSSGRSTSPTGATGSPSGGTGEDLPDVEPGDTIKHPKFGEGRIMEISGSKDSPIAKIDFDTVGIKQLALSFARLDSA
jgi:DNA helicase-2/ATP-dependent DNA helicase PcrA